MSVARTGESENRSNAIAVNRLRCLYDADDGEENKLAFVAFAYRFADDVKTRARSLVVARERNFDSMEIEAVGPLKFSARNIGVAKRDWEKERKRERMRRE